MLTYDPVANIRHYPSPMGKYGLNPYGETLYRIVWAASRRYLVIGDWKLDGQIYGEWIVKHKAFAGPPYSHDSPCWIMEKWMPATHFEPTREAWDRLRAQTLGPWPERGDYELCHAFEVCDPVQANIEKLVQWVEMGKQYSLAEKTVFAHKETAAENAAKSAQADMRIRECLPAFGVRTFSGGHVSRREVKLPNLRYSANELGLPTSGGLSTKPNPPQQAA